MVKLKRAYDERGDDDGTRVLVDRVWPRGVTKERAAVDWWAKGLAPSEELRKWFGHDPRRFEEFAERYRAELDGNPDLERLRRLAREGEVTLVFGAKDREHNQAVVLRSCSKADRARPGVTLDPVRSGRPSPVPPRCAGAARHRGCRRRASAVVAGAVQDASGLAAGELGQVGASDLLEREVEVGGQVRDVPQDVAQLGRQSRALLV